MSSSSSTASLSPAVNSGIGDVKSAGFNALTAEAYNKLKEATLTQYCFIPKTKEEAKKIASGSGRLWSQLPVTGYDSLDMKSGYLPWDVKALTPASLPAGFEWYDFDTKSPADIKTLQIFLDKNNTIDVSCLVRKCYSTDFLSWYLCSNKSWTACIRTQRNISAFIAGVLRSMTVGRNTEYFAEISLMCVDTALRGRHIVPLLIKELMRKISAGSGRLKISGIYSMINYVQRPLATYQIFGRPINIQKLLDIGILPTPSGDDLKNTSLDTEINKMISSFGIYTNSLTPNFREMKVGDIPRVKELINEWKDKYHITINFSETDIKNIFISPQIDVSNSGSTVIRSFVIETEASAIEEELDLEKMRLDAINNSKKKKGANVPKQHKLPVEAKDLKEVKEAKEAKEVKESKKVITDFVSYYITESTVLHHASHRKVREGYLYYHSINVSPYNHVISNVLLDAKRHDVDVLYICDSTAISNYLDENEFIPKKDLQYVYLGGYTYPESGTEQINFIPLF